MKINKIISLIGFVSIFMLLISVLPACNEELESDDSVHAEKFETVDIKVEGMTCTGCEKHITDAIMALDGINHAKLSHIEGNAIVEFDKSQTTKKDIVAAINGSGYKVVE